MDGVRAYWDGEKLLSRHGNKFAAPTSFTRSIPKGVALDGELWMGRGSFEKLMALLNSNNQDWSGIQYRIFDLPNSKLIFKERILQLRQMKLPLHVHLLHCNHSHRFLLYPTLFATVLHI